MTPFVPFPKIPRLARGMVITEKLDGTNASIKIERDYLIVTGPQDITPWTAGVEHDGVSYRLLAGSRTRWLHPSADNFGFARWVWENAARLVRLGEGHHFGEWWGSGIQRGYGLTGGDKRFSLFNVNRWTYRELAAADIGLDNVRAVPVLWQGPFHTDPINAAMGMLQINGSYAAPGFKDPEGIVIFHEGGANYLFKKTFKGDSK